MNDTLSAARTMMADLSRESSLGFQNALMAIRLEMEERGLLSSIIYRDRLLQLGRDEITARAERHWVATADAFRAAGMAITEDLAERIWSCLKDATQSDANAVHEVLRRELSPHALSIDREDLRDRQGLIASRQRSQVGVLRSELAREEDDRGGPAGTKRPVEDQDHLTGVLTRKALDEDLPDVMAHARQSGLPLGLIMIDIDHFKQINDGRGHPTGDAVLRGVCQRLVLVTSNKGHVYRYGGEEFTIVLPNHTIEEATAVAERVRRSIESDPVEQVTVTASFGVAASPSHGEDPAQLVESSDQALRDAKRRGRNLVRVFGELEPTPEPRRPERKQPETGKLSEAERAKVRSDFFSQRAAFCPRDQALLLVLKDHTTGRNPRLFVTCPNCGLKDEA